jgi:predicted alpha/beta-hydrolase family hydrolase
VTTYEIGTPHGPARVSLHCVPEGRAALLLGHGAGGGVTAPDLVAATQAAHRAGVHVALVPLVFGGRSSGARVACRTADEGGAAAVLCLAFPVHPPAKPHQDRTPELAAVEVPVLVVQGERDPFGCPESAPHRVVLVQPGDHSLKGDLAGLGRAVTEWLERVLRPL